MDLPTSIVTSTAIVVGTATLWRFFFWNKKNNPGNNSLRKDMNEKLSHVVFKDTCNAYREGEKRQFEDLQKTVSDGFGSVNDQLKEIRKDLREKA